jgi:type IV pilus assembly protein PilE
MLTSRPTSRFNAVPSAAGFTLVELMVTVTIAAILFAIAIPSYNSQIRKSRRTEARTALLDLAGREERYLSTNNAYTATAASLGYTAFPQTVGSGYYTLAAPNVPAPAAGTVASFTVSVTPIAGTTQANDAQCQSFAVTSTGKQSSADGGGNDTTSTCWQ